MTVVPRLPFSNSKVVVFGFLFFKLSEFTKTFLSCEVIHAVTEFWLNLISQRNLS